MLDRWVRQGLLTPEQAQQIYAAEQAGRVPAPAPETPAGPAGIQAPAPAESPPPAAPPAAPPRAGLAVEALGYLGGLLAIAATMILLGMYWEDLSTAVRLALSGVTAVALIGAGLAAGSGTEAGHGQRGRLRAVLWLLSVGATAAFLAILGGQSLDLASDDTVLLVGAGSAAVAAVLYARCRSILQHLALFGTVALTAGALGARVHWDEPTIVGLAVWGVGVAWFAAGELGWLAPAGAARYVGAAGAVFSGAALTQSGWGNVLALLTIAALFAGGVRLDSLGLLGIAAYGVLQIVPASVDYFFPGRLAVPVALLVTGGLLVGLAVVVARRHARGERQPSARSRE